MTSIALRSGGTRPIPLILAGENDTLRGDTGPDDLVGGPGEDVLHGGPGDDTLGTPAGADPRRSPEDGNDTFNGGAGADLIGAGAGDDLAAGGSGDDTLEGGTGRDTLLGETGHDRLSGEDGDDLLAGGDGNDTLWGEAGADTLLGGEGRDTGFGGDGADLLAGGAEADSLMGGAGDDIIAGGSGDDRVWGDDGNDLILGGAGADTLRGNGIGEGFNALGPRGNLEAGADTLFGGEGNDWIGAGAGDDRAGGGSGDDSLRGEAGADTLAGGDGADLLVGGSMSALYTPLLADTDPGADMLFGGAGNDTLIGGGGRDLLAGGTGDDLLRGGDDDDTLAGATGSDTLTGGGGDDVFVLVPGGAVTITDFRITPSAVVLDFNGLAAGRAVPPGYGGLGWGAFVAPETGQLDSFAPAIARAPGVVANSARPLGISDPEGHAFVVEGGTVLKAAGVEASIRTWRDGAAVETFALDLAASRADLAAVLAGMLPADHIEIHGATGPGGATTAVSLDSLAIRWLEEAQADLLRVAGPAQAAGLLASAIDVEGGVAMSFGGIEVTLLGQTAAAATLDWFG